MLTESELAAMRHTVGTQALPTLCSIQTKALTSDGQGGQRATWATVTNVPCRLSPETSGIGGVQDAGKWSLHTPWVLTLAHDYSVSTGNRVVIGSDTYEVLRVESGKSWNTATRAHLRRLD